MQKGDSCPAESTISGKLCLNYLSAVIALILATDCVPALEAHRCTADVDKVRVDLEVVADSRRKPYFRVCDVAGGHQSNLYAAAVTCIAQGAVASCASGCGPGGSLYRVRNVTLARRLKCLCPLCEAKLRRMLGYEHNFEPLHVK